MKFFETLRAITGRQHKGQLGSIINAFIGFAVLVIVVAVALLVGANTYTQASALGGANSYAALGVNQTNYSAYQMTQWLPIVVVVLIGSVLIGLVLSAFRPRM